MSVCWSPNGESAFKTLVFSSPICCRNTHAHGSHYNPIMQQPALLASHVTLPAAQPLNVGVAHVMRQQPTSTTSSRKNKQHQSSARYALGVEGKGIFYPLHDPSPLFFSGEGERGWIKYGTSCLSWNHLLLLPHSRNKVSPGDCSIVRALP